MSGSNSLTPHFSQTYAEARDKFLSAAASRGLQVESVVHPLRGRDGEELATDLAWIGPSSAPDVLLLSSGTHGVEGYCGSGVQTALLNDESFLAALARGGAALLFLHALNPYGFSHLRRVNEDNVDVNRNFRDFSKPPAANAGYAQLHPMLVPQTWPPDAQNQASVGGFIAARGMAAMQAVVTRGQSEYADGLFYAGIRPVWSNETLREVMRARVRGRRRLGWLDFHTGLGPAGHGEKIHAGANDAQALARTRAWFGADVTSLYDGSSASAQVDGALFHAALQECPEVELTGIGLEFGTQPLADVFTALRGEQWLQNHPDTAPSLHAQIKKRMRDAFYTDTAEWQGMVYGQSRAAAFQALAALSAG